MPEAMNRYIPVCPPIARQIAFIFQSAASACPEVLSRHGGEKLARMPDIETLADKPTLLFQSVLFAQLPQPIAMLTRQLPYALPLLAISFCAFAQQAQEDPKDLTALRQSWTNAKAQANAPLDKKYREALEAMKLRYTKSGDLKSAVSVDHEISLISGEQVTAPIKTTTSTPDQMSRSEFLKRLEKTTWAWESPEGTHEKNWEVTFNKNGTIKFWHSERERKYECKILGQITVLPNATGQKEDIFIFNRDANEFTDQKGNKGRLLPRK